MKRLKNNAVLKGFNTSKRNLSLISNSLRKYVFVYNGKTIIPIKINRSLFGIKIGAMSLRKKLAKAIDNSERNKKRKQKKNKISSI